MREGVVRPRLTRASGILLASSLPWWLVPAQADQWFVEPRATLKTDYDDNVRLTVKDPVSSFRIAGDVKVETGRRTEVSEIGLLLRADTQKYLSSEVEDLDRTNGAIDLTSSYRLGRAEVGLKASVDYDSTLTSEESTSGFVQANKRRTRLVANPQFSYTLTPRATLEAQVSLEDVTYDDVELIPYFDYRFLRGSTTASYALSERAQVFGRLSFDQYEAEQAGAESESVGVEGGFSYLFSETTSMTLFGGWRRTEAENQTFFGTIESENSGPLLELSLRKRFDVGQVKAELSRSLLPSSSGSLVDTTRLSFGLEYPLGPRWTLGVDVAAYRNRNPDSDRVSSEDRDYLSLLPSLRRRLTESLQLGLSYRYRWQSYDLASEDASSNAIFLSLIYQMPREPLGRWSLLR